MIERHTEKPSKYFPKLTVCPNSIHSLEKINKKYEFINATILRDLYGGCSRNCEQPVSLAVPHIKDIF